MGKQRSIGVPRRNSSGSCHAESDRETANPRAVERRAEGRACPGLRAARNNRRTLKTPEHALARTFCPAGVKRNRHRWSILAEHHHAKTGMLPAAPAQRFFAFRCDAREGKPKSRHPCAARPAPRFRRAPCPTQPKETWAYVARDSPASRSQRTPPARRAIGSFPTCCVGGALTGTFSKRRHAVHRRRHVHGDHRHPRLS